MRVLAKLLIRPEATWNGIARGERPERKTLVRFISTSATPSRGMYCVPAEGWAGIPIETVFLDWEGNVTIHLRARDTEAEPIDVEGLVEAGWEKTK